MNLHQLIGEIISMRQNDLLISKRYFEDNGEEWNYKEVESVFESLQTALTRLAVGHNYCGNPDCQCSAKTSIEKTFNRHEPVLKEHLYEDQYRYLADKEYLSGGDVE